MRPAGEGSQASGMKNTGKFLDTFLGHPGKPGAWDQGGAWPQKQVSQPWQPPPEPALSPEEQEAIRRKKMAAQPAERGLLDRARDMMGMGAGGAAGAAAAAGGGGVLGWLFGRGSTGRSLLTHGGAAALGALAYRAWQSWQAGRGGQAAPAAATPQTVPPAFTPGATPAAGGEPFELALIRAMVAAAKADGHIDAAERGRIFEAVERSPLDAEHKGFVFTLLNQDITLEQIAAAAAGQEQASQIWLAARMVLELDHAAERAFLEGLTARLALPAELVAQLEHQVQEALRGPPQTA